MRTLERDLVVGDTRRLQPLEQIRNAPGLDRRDARERTADHAHLLQQRSLPDVALRRLRECEARGFDVAVGEHRETGRDVGEAHGAPEPARQLLVDAGRGDEPGQVVAAGAG